MVHDLIAISAHIIGTLQTYVLQTQRAPSRAPHVSLLWPRPLPADSAPSSLCEIAMPSLAEQVACLQRELDIDPSLSMAVTLNKAAEMVEYTPAPGESLLKRARGLLESIGKWPLEASEEQEHVAASKLQAAQRANSTRRVSEAHQQEIQTADMKVRQQEMKSTVQNVKEMVAERKAEMAERKEYREKKEAEVAERKAEMAVRKAYREKKEAEREIEKAQKAELEEAMIASAGQNLGIEIGKKDVRDTDAAAAKVKIQLRIVLPSNWRRGDKMAKVKMANDEYITCTVPTNLTAGSALMMSFERSPEEVETIHTKTIEIVSRLAATVDDLHAQVVRADTVGTTALAATEQLPPLRCELHQIRQRIGSIKQSSDTRTQRIESCQSQSTVLNPQLWLRGGISGKIERQRSKLQAEETELAGLERRAAELAAEIEKREAEGAAAALDVSNGTRPNLEAKLEQAVNALLTVGVPMPLPLHEWACQVHARAQQQNLHTKLAAIERVYEITRHAAALYTSAHIALQTASTMNAQATVHNYHRMRDGFSLLPNIVDMSMYYGQEMWEVSERNRLIFTSEHLTIQGNTLLEHLQREIPVIRSHVLKTPLTIATEKPMTMTLTGQLVCDGFRSALRNARLSEELQTGNMIRTNLTELVGVVGLGGKGIMMRTQTPGGKLNDLRKALTTVKAHLAASIDRSMDVITPVSPPALGSTTPPDPPPVALEKPVLRGAPVPMGIAIS